MAVRTRKVQRKTVLEQLTDKQQAMLDKDVGSDQEDDDEERDYYWSEHDLDSTFAED